jgi:hypothetical protein
MKLAVEIGLIAVSVATLSCGGREHVRPDGVPPNAVWAGGVDGGNWITCSANAGNGFNQCIVYHDFTGEVRLSGEFALEALGRPATRDELDFRYADILDRSIYLENNKKLVLRRETD